MDLFRHELSMRSWLSIAARVIRSSNAATFVVLGLVVVYACYFSYYTVLKHQSFHSFAYDLGIFVQYFSNMLDGDGVLYTSVTQRVNFAAHFMPVLFFFMPAYALVPRPETLLVIQSFAISLGAVPVYLIARRDLGQWPGVVLAGVYLLYPALHGVNSFDFHPVAFAIAPLLTSFYMFKTGRHRWALGFALIALLCKENVALVVGAMGLYWLWESRHGAPVAFERRLMPQEPEARYSLVFVGLGVVWLALTVGVLIPHFNTEGAYPYLAKYHYDNALYNVFLVPALKAAYLAKLLAPLAMVPILGLAQLVVALPAFAQNIMTTHVDQMSIQFHYSALVIPGVMIATISGLKRLATVKGRLDNGVVYRALAVVMASTLLAVALTSPSPLALNQMMPRVGAHEHILNRAISLIPEKAAVYTQNDRYPHVCERLHAYVHLPRPGTDMFEFYGGQYEYILMDTTSEQCTLNFATEDSLKRLEREYGVYAEGDGVVLYERGYSGESIDLTAEQGET